MANKTVSDDARFFLGFHTMARADWFKYLLEPKPHGSIKDEAKKQADIADKRARQEALAPTIPIAGTLLAAAIVDVKGDVVAQFELGNNQPGYVSVKLLETIDELLKGPHEVRRPFTNIEEYRDVQTRLFGLFIRDRMRLTALDALHYAAQDKKTQVKVPLGLWYHRPFTYGCFLDPVDAVAPTDMKNEVDFASVCDFLGVAVPPPESWVSPVVQANIAREIALAAQLFPV